MTPADADNSVGRWLAACRLAGVVDFQRSVGGRAVSRVCARLALAFVVTAVVTLGDAQSAPLVGVDALQPARAPTAELQRAAELVRDKQLDQAVVLLEQLIARFPADPGPYNELAVIHARRDDLDRARALLIAAIEANPRYALVYKNLQTVFGALAGRAYDRALLRSAAARQAPALSSFIEGGSKDGSNSGSLLASAEPPAPPPTQSLHPPLKPSVTPRAVVSLPAPDVVEAVAAGQSSPSSGQTQADAPLASAVPAATGNPGQEQLTSADAGGPASSHPDEVIATLKAWAKAWSKQDVEQYLGFYGHHHVTPGGMSRARWRAQRRQRLRRPRFIEVVVQDVEVTFSTADRAVARFRQAYRSNLLTSTVTKILRLSRADGEWKIIRESVQR